MLLVTIILGVAGGIALVSFIAYWCDERERHTVVNPYGRSDAFVLKEIKRQVKAASPQRWLPYLTMEEAAEVDTQYRAHLARPGRRIAGL